MNLVGKYWRWLCELSAFWAALLLIASSLLVVTNLFPTESGIRLVGLILQVVGVASVLAGIERSRRDFDLPPIYELLHRWLRRAPWIHPKPIHGNASTNSGIQTTSAVGVVTVRVGHGTVEERLQILEDAHNKALDSWAMQVLSLEEAKREILKRIDSEKELRELASGMSEERLKKTVLGGIGTAFAGSVVLLAGIIMSTASPELARLIV